MNQLLFTSELGGFDLPILGFLLVASLLSVDGPFRFHVRVLTLLGASQVNGFLSSYPGHTTPFILHFEQTGRAESQTNRRRWHSQHCRLPPPIAVCAGVVGGRASCPAARAVIFARDNGCLDALGY
ncbi:hypothetical protein Ct61P_12613 [Colletotrichum tofieldiae]|nr:hypothetical protein Ct61P_12613 [Colletotrichum tofieldiae]